VNSRRTLRDRKIIRIASFGAAAVVVLLLLPKIASFAAALALAPVHSFNAWLANSSSSFPQYLRDRGALLSEIEELERKQSAQSGTQYTIERLSHENEELRSLLGTRGEETRIAAGIIGRPNKLPYDVLVLDKGASDGIVERAPVFIDKDTVIGVVAKVFDTTSVVELITTPGFTASVYIVGPNIYTNAEGQGGGVLRVGVPQGIPLHEGDLVILPSIDSGIYGAVSAVDSVPTQPEQYGYVSPHIAIASLHYVSVGNMPLEPVSFEEAQQIVASSTRELFKVPIPEGVLVTTSGSTTASTTATSSEPHGATTTRP
jgi:cell shape-determining protein MreC